jgi:hypothetical protein
LKIIETSKMMMVNRWSLGGSNRKTGEAAWIKILSAQARAGPTATGSQRLPVLAPVKVSLDLQLVVEPPPEKISRFYG